MRMLCGFIPSSVCVHYTEEAAFTQSNAIER